MTSHEDKMGIARLYVTQKAPYFSSIVHGFIYIPMPGIRTMLVTSGMVLGYDPAWAERGSVEELGADIAHECHHFIRRHFWRKGMADPALFNRAGDLAINPDLRNSGWKLASDAIFPKQDHGFPEGLTTEEYYDLLLQQKQQKEEEDKKDGSSGGASAGAAGEDGEAGAGEGEKKPGIASGCCGSISGHAADGERTIPHDVAAEPRSEIEIHAIELRAAQDFRDYQQKLGASGRGAAPAFMSEFLKALDELPVVAWEDELASISHDCVGTMQSGGDDYSLLRPSKRSYVRGMLRPGLVEYQPEVAFILDTSGSMGEEQLLGVAREVVGIMEALGIDEIWWAEADAAVSMTWQRIQLEFLRNLRIEGRGGTDFRPAIKSAEELHPRPDLLFYGTDGDGPAPAEAPPGMEVIWVVVPSHWNRAPAPWGHTVFASNDPKARRAFNEQYQKMRAQWAPEPDD